jgi:PPOX class probable F420-dependent enzyme
LWLDESLTVDDLETARYTSLTTFKRDGSSVATPVWITGTAGSYAFTTGDRAWKTRRLSRNSSVQVQVCDMRGRVKPDAEQYLGTGDVVTSSDAVAAAERALAAKYGWQFKATKVVDGIKDRLSRGAPQQVVAVQLSLTAS